MRSLLLISICAMLGACGTPVKTVPFTVQSEPLGAYVLYQLQADREEERTYDWIFLGNTPLNTRRSMTKEELKNADAFVIRVIKDGYLEQQKAWTGQQLVNEAQSKGTVFWNPKLVPSSQ